MPHALELARRGLVASLLLSLSFQHLKAQDPAFAAAAEIARKIAPGAGEDMALSVRSLSGLAPAEVERARQLLERELERLGARLSSLAAAPSVVTVTISDNAAGPVWVAEVMRAAGRQVVMAAPRPGEVRPGAARMSGVLEKRLLLEADGPILDAALVEGGRLLVLEPESVALVDRNGTRESRRSVALPPGRIVPRDLRGRILAEGNGFRVYLPRLRCSGTLSPAFGLDCAEADAEWPLELARARLEAGRNYFVHPDLPPFYSAAGGPEGSKAPWVITGIDGLARIYDRGFRIAGSVSGWGSDAAGIDAECGPLVLLTRPSRDGESDLVQAFRVSAGSLTPVSAPVELPGPATALWAWPDRKSAVAVTRDPDSGRHAAFHISIACGR